MHIGEAFDNLKAYEPVSDPADAVTKEEQRQGHLRMLEREKKLLDKYDDACSAWPAANTAGAGKPASRSACAACCYDPPRPLASKPRSARKACETPAPNLTAVHF